MRMYPFLCSKYRIWTSLGGDDGGLVLELFFVENSGPTGSGMRLSTSSGTNHSKSGTVEIHGESEMSSTTEKTSEQKSS